MAHRPKPKALFADTSHAQRAELRPQAMTQSARKFFAYATTSKKPAANGEYIAIFENIYCTWIKIE
jgi:hypothetical protein